MIRLYSTLFAGLVSAAPAFAMQKFEEYRFFGNEIQSVLLGVQEVEDPATLIIDLISGSGAAQQVILESDGGLDDCKQTIDYTIGDASRYIEIRVHTTADTMNGVIVTECTSISAVGY